MKVIDNTLKVVTGEWSDPGDYPSAGGSAPLPSHPTVEDIEGYITVEFDPKTHHPMMDNFWMNLVGLLDETAGEVLKGLHVVEWRHRLLGNTVISEIVQFDASRCELVRDERSYEE